MTSNRILKTLCIILSLILVFSVGAILYLLKTRVNNISSDGFSAGVLKSSEITDIKDSEKLTSELITKNFKESSVKNIKEEIAAKALEKKQEAENQKNHNKAKAGKNRLAKEDYAYNTADVRRWMNDRHADDYPEEKVVFLTFDDGPSVNTEKILDTLKENDVHATFFILTGGIERKADSVNRICKEGNSLAFHSNSHVYSYLYPDRVANVTNIQADMNEGIAKLKKILGQNFNPTVFRYPGGHMSWKGLDQSDKMLRDYGMEWIDWNTMLGDANPDNPDKSPSGLLNYMKKKNVELNVSGVVVVLMHDANDKKSTADSLQSVIDYYKSLGYKFGVLV